MGCSAGVIAVKLAQQLLRDSPGKLALVVSTENITQNWYEVPAVPCLCTRMRFNVNQPLAEEYGEETARPGGGGGRAVSQQTRLIA